MATYTSITYIRKSDTFNRSIFYLNRAFIEQLKRLKHIGKDLK